MDHFFDRLADAVRRCGNPVLVGLDPRRERLPEGLVPATIATDCDSWADAYREFCRGVIDVVATLVPAVKPQAAFFEELGPAGMAALADVIGYASGKGLIVILDGKRNDIGSTATAYANGLLGPAGQSPWAADALTVSPYLGDDSLTPFVDVARNDVLLEEELQAVCDRLKQAQRSDAIGSAPVLHPRGDLALEVDAVSNDAQQDADHRAGQHDADPHLTCQKLLHDPLLRAALPVSATALEQCSA